mgnify:CR=1 FL=1
MRCKAREYLKQEKLKKMKKSGIQLSEYKGINLIVNI